MRTRLREWWRKITQDIRNDNYEPWCILALLLVSASAMAQAPVDIDTRIADLTKQQADVKADADLHKQAQAHIEALLQDQAYLRQIEALIKQLQAQKPKPDAKAPVK